ncbi:Xaa-Pro dipeptidase [Candidatus Omnitrophus magneticus]|uniref:Xaa-Pro dipeptidase n=1 Tax=Candidatus Omnitrophus magneticus TaxID=1609969 RepID=A0A0F0CNP8_9BACT|nr:Xaa-Pro dipeptidase [Candidatus Omnitrophus magneticus]
MNHQNIYNNFLEKARDNIKENGLDALIVSFQSDIKYITGFYIEGAVLFIHSSAQSVYFTDKMNETLVRDGLLGINVEVRAGAFIEGIKNYIRETSVKNLGIDENSLSLVLYTRLIKENTEVNFISKSGDIIKNLRLLKEDFEIEHIKKAAKETVKIWNNIKKEIKPGIREIDLAFMIDIAMREKGYENSFKTITAFAENTSYPHAISGNRKLKANEHVLADFGLKVNGYCSDLTRIWANGRINPSVKNIEKYVRFAQESAIKMIGHGVNISVVVQAADKVFTENILDKYVCHSLGHGVGLDIHEEPFLRSNSNVVLRKGMIITVEPGLYIPGVGGIRIEDMVLVTEKGCEVLTR